MKQKRMTVLAVSCGVVCAICIAVFMIAVQKQADSARAEELARYGGEQTEVCVATRDIAAGERLDISSLEMKTWVAGLLPDEAVTDSGEILGETTTSPIMKGEVIVSKRFEKEHGTLDIPAGKQALSVPVKTVQAVGGAVQPGMSVDIYTSGDSTTAALASDVIVLDSSVGSSGSLTSSDGGWVTLALEPERVQEVIAASNKTSLYFVLPGDQKEKGQDNE